MIGTKVSFVKWIFSFFFSQKIYRGIFLLLSLPEIEMSPVYPD